MTVGILRVVLFIHESNSLKEKRMIIHSLKARLRNNFNIAVTQLDDGDKWQKAVLALAGVEKNRPSMDSLLSRLINFIEGFRKVDIIDYEMEMI